MNESTKFTELFLPLPTDLVRRVLEFHNWGAAVKRWEQEKHEFESGYVYDPSEMFDPPHGIRCRYAVLNPAAIRRCELDGNRVVVWFSEPFVVSCPDDEYAQRFYESILEIRDDLR